MIRFAILAAAVFAVVGCSPSTPDSTSTGPAAYITGNDDLYHQAGCRETGETTKYNRDDLIAQGYNPCPVCHPGIEPVERPAETPKPEPQPVAAPSQPQPQRPAEQRESTQDTRTSRTLVYTTAAGAKYHLATCRTIKNSETVESTIAVAIRDGYDACKVCNPPQR